MRAAVSRPMPRRSEPSLPSGSWAARSPEPFMTLPRFIATICFALALTVAAPVLAQEHAQPPANPLPTQQGAQPARPAETAGEHAGTEEEHPNEAISMIARLLNFGVLVGTLVYFLKSPVVSYLVSRGAQIRQELVTAS